MELPGLSIYLLYIFCVPLPYLHSASHHPLHPLTRNCLFTFMKLLVFRFFQLTLTLRHGVKYNHGPDILSSYSKERKGFKIENKPGRGADR